MEPGQHVRGDRRITVASALALLLAAEAVFAPLAQAHVWAERRVAITALTPSQPSRFLPALPPLRVAFGKLPASLGSVKAANNISGARTVLLVQDVHFHKEGQRAVSRIVSDFSQQADFVALEAAFTPLRLSGYVNFPCRAAVVATADYLLKKNRISGAVHGAMVGAVHLPIIGIDDAAAYRDNVQALKNGAFKRKEVAAQVRSEQSALSQQRNAVFSSALLAFDRAVIGYHNEKTSLTDHVAFLAAGQNNPLFNQFLAITRAEAALDFAVVERERRILANELMRRLPQNDLRALTQSLLSHRLGNTSALTLHNELMAMGEKAGRPSTQFPHLAAYLKYLTLADRLDPEALMTAVADAERRGYTRLAQTMREKELIATSEATRLAADLVAHSLTPDTWKRYLALRASLTPALSALMPTFEHFYTAAERRDVAMADNLIREMNSRGAKNAVLVVGGFHKNGIAHRLAAQNIRTLVFTPTLNDVSDDNSAYVSAFVAERTPLDRLFRPRRLTVAPLPFPPAVELAEGPGRIAVEEVRDGHHAAGDVTDVVTQVTPASGVTANATKTTDDAEVELHLGQRNATVRVDGENADDGSDVSASLVANLFSGRWSFLNWGVRLLFIGAVVPHELGHLIAGPASGTRRSHGVWRIMKGLLYSMPWRVRGPTAFAGLYANMAIFSVLTVRLLVLPNVFEGPTPLRIVLFYLGAANFVLFVSELILTPMARSLGIVARPDLWMLHTQRILERIRPSTKGSQRHHHQIVDVQKIPSALRPIAEKTFRQLLELRPLVGKISIGKIDAVSRRLAGGDTSALNAPHADLVSWDRDGNITVDERYFTAIQALIDNGAATLAQAEQPTRRFLVILILRASYQWHQWNRLPNQAEPSNFEVWARTAEDLFPVENEHPVSDFFDQYRKETESPRTTATEQVRRAAATLRYSTTETEQLVEPDWIYRFEIPMTRDNGDQETFVGWRVHHNDALGNYKGGFRITKNFLPDEAADLAREMSTKTAVVNLPLGGGKGGIRADIEKFSDGEKARLIRGYVRELHRQGAIGPRIDVPAPDMATTPAMMAWFLDEYIQQEMAAGNIKTTYFGDLIGVDRRAEATDFLERYIERWKTNDVLGTPLAVVTGKPEDKGGIPGRTEATAQGIYYVGVKAVKHYLGRDDIKGMRVAIQGFGNVGMYTAKIFHDAGAVIVSVSDQYAGVSNPNGIDIPSLVDHVGKPAHGRAYPFEGFSQDGTVVTLGATQEPLFAEADIIIPAARQKEFTEDNVAQIHPSVKMILEAANGPLTPEADAWLRDHRPDLVVIPDVLTNAGGVSVSHFEWERNMGFLPRDITMQQVNVLLKTKMEEAAGEIFFAADSQHITPRDAAYVVAIKRIHEAAVHGYGKKKKSGALAPVLPPPSGPLALMPWFAPIYRLASRNPLSAALTAGIFGFVEEAVIRRTLQPLIAAAVESVLPGAPLSVAIIVYAVVFATALHLSVVRPNGGRLGSATADDRLRLLSFALALGVVAAVLPVPAPTAFALIGVIHGLFEGTRAYRANRNGRSVAGREKETALIVSAWMEGRVAGQEPLPPFLRTLFMLDAAELDQQVRNIDGRNAGSVKLFDRRLFERALAHQIQTSPALSALSPRQIAELLGEGLSLSVDDVKRHQAAIADQRLTTVYADESLGMEAAEAALRRYVDEHRRAGRGRTVLAVSPTLQALAEGLRAQTPDIVVVVSETPADTLTLTGLEENLIRHNAFEGMTSVRLVLATSRPLDVSGLSAQSPLHSALILMINEALQTSALTFPRLETIINVVKLAQQNA